MKSHGTEFKAARLSLSLDRASVAHLGGRHRRAGVLFGCWENAACRRLDNHSNGDECEYVARDLSI